MLQHKKSERTRSQILNAALKLFSKQVPRNEHARHRGRGPRVDGQRLPPVPGQGSDPPDTPRSVLGRSRLPRVPVQSRAAPGAFPDDLEALAAAGRETAQKYRPYIALIYVDVVEFEGSHIRRFYQEMANRFQAFLDARPDLVGKLRPGVSPLSAVMVVSRSLLYYYSRRNPVQRAESFRQAERRRRAGRREVLRTRTAEKLTEADPAPRSV